MEGYDARPRFTMWNDWESDYKLLHAVGLHFEDEKNQHAYNMLESRELLLKKNDHPIELYNGFPAGFPGFWRKDFNGVSLEGIQRGEEVSYLSARCYHREDRPWVEADAVVWDVFIQQATIMLIVPSPCTTRWEFEVKYVSPIDIVRRRVFYTLQPPIAVDDSADESTAF